MSSGARQSVYRCDGVEEAGRKAEQAPEAGASQLLSSAPCGMDGRYGARTVRAYIYRPEFELYDVEADPYESHNLADDPGHNAVLEEHIEKLRAFEARTSDPWLVEWGVAEPTA